MDPTTLPTGTVTFLFTDIEGSTRLWEQQHAAMQEALARHDALLRSAIERHQGYVFKTGGDGFCAAFPDAAAAVQAAVAAQWALGKQVPELRVRMALHSGEAELREGDYFGPALSRVARLRDAGHGGQILLSQAAAEQVTPCLPEDLRLRVLGTHRLRDLAGKETIYQLIPPGLPADFPPLNTLEVAYRRGLVRATAVMSAFLVSIGALALSRARLAEERKTALIASRRLLYAADVSVAQQAWEVNHLGRARELLKAHRPRPGEEELRGFEWRYLWRLCQDQSLFTLKGDTGWLFSVAFSPDGKILASASETLKVWDLTTRKEIATLNAHAEGVASVAFSPDGKTLASGGEDGTVRLWDVATWRERATFQGHTAWVPYVAFSPDGKTLATASGDRTVKLWDVAARREVATLVGHEGQVRAVVFSADGMLLATGSFDRTARLWDLRTRQAIATLESTGQVVALSPDGKTLATGGNPIKLWDVATKRERHAPWQCLVGGVLPRRQDPGRRR